MPLKRGHKKCTPYGRSYEVLAGPFKTNDGREKVYVIRDWHDGVVRLMGYKHLEGMEDGDG